MANKITLGAKKVAGDEAHSPGKGSLKKPSQIKPRGPRVSDEELERRPTLHMASTEGSTKGKPKFPEGVTYTPLGDGRGTLIGCSLAETVRVAEFANVVVGPVSMQWVHGGLDMSIFDDHEWGSEMTPDQATMFTRAYNSGRATLGVCETIVAEDRETVERSIRQYAERAEAEEAAAKKSVAKSRARSR